MKKKAESQTKHKSLFFRVTPETVEILNELVERHKHLDLNKTSVVCALIHAAYEENWRFGFKPKKRKN